MEIINIDTSLVKEYLPKRSDSYNKGDCGQLVSVVGSRTMNGAAIMSALSAMRTGVGLTTVLTPEYTAKVISSAIYEAMCVPLKEENGAISIEAYPVIESYIKNATAVLIGCGITVNDSIKQIVKNIVENTNSKIIIDADGINCLSFHKDSLYKTKSDIIITPHIGEMARFLGLSTDYVSEHQIDIAKEVSGKYNITVVLKSSETIVAGKGGNLFVNRTGNSSLAKGGSGDVLSGMVASFIAQGIDSYKACCIACYLLGKTAEYITKENSKYSLLARDIIDKIPATLKELEI